MIRPTAICASPITGGQLSFNKAFHDVHRVNAIAGGEIRENVVRSNNYRLYGYDDAYGTAVTNLDFSNQLATNPQNTDRISSGASNVAVTTNRYISYYANVAYTYQQLYTATLSGRKDGANIFGVNTNQKIAPFWSAGVAWKISNEKWYTSKLFPYLNLRASYGYNGNLYNSSAYLTASYGTDDLTGMQSAGITRPPNPIPSLGKK